MQTKEIAKSLKKLEAHIQSIEHWVVLDGIRGYAFEAPKDNTNYLMTCRWFSKKKSIIQVFDVETKNQVAVSHRKIKSAVDFAEFARDIGVKYNNALIVVDSNNEGLAAFHELKQIYENVYSPQETPFAITKTMKLKINEHIMGALELTPPIINCPIVFEDIKKSLLEDKEFGYTSLLFGLALHMLEDTLKKVVSPKSNSDKRKELLEEIRINAESKIKNGLKIDSASLRRLHENNENTHFLLFEKVEGGCKYILTSCYKKDANSTVQVINVNTKNQAYEYQGFLEDERTFSSFVQKIGHYFNNALIVVDTRMDSRDEGVFVSEIIRKEYDNFYCPPDSNIFSLDGNVLFHAMNHLLDAIEVFGSTINSPILINDINSWLFESNAIEDVSLMFGVALYVLELTSTENAQHKPDNNNFREYVKDGNFIDAKPKGLAKVKCYFNGLTELEVGRNVFISGPKQCGKTLLLLNYAIYLFKNTNCFIAFMSNNENSDKRLKEKLAIMIGNKTNSPSEHAGIYDGKSFKNEWTGSQIIFTNNLKDIQPTHLFIDDIDCCLEKECIVNEVFEEKSSVKTKIKKSNMQKVLTCLSGFEKWIDMDNAHNDFKVSTHMPLTEKELNDFEYIDDLNKTEITSLRLESNLLNQAKSEAEESGKNVSEYMRTLIERDIKLKKEKNQDRVTKEKFFLNLIKGSVLRFDPDKYPNQTFLFKDEKLIMMSENNCPLVHHKIWDAYEKEFNTSTNEKWVINFIDDMDELSFIAKKVLENYLGLKVGGEPQSGWHIREEEWVEIENWFNKTPLTF